MVRRDLLRGSPRLPEAPLRATLRLQRKLKLPEQGLPFLQIYCRPPLRRTLKLVPEAGLCASFSP
jgi:hypothetical protein